MATSADSTLFDEQFSITEINDLKYERVSRLTGTSADNAIEVKLDINTELYSVGIGENLRMVIASTLALDGTKDEKGWREVGAGETTLADAFDYVCHGKIYKFEDKEDGQTIKAYVSFGGLLMSIEGPYKKLTPLRVDHVYLLVRK